MEKRIIEFIYLYFLNSSPRIFLNTTLLVYFPMEIIFELLSLWFPTSMYSFNLLFNLFSCFFVQLLDSLIINSTIFS